MRSELATDPDAHTATALGCEMRGARMTKLLEDRRGASTISNLLVLPLLILIIFGSFQVWRLISVKYTLHVATSQAVRCISMYDARNATLAMCEDILRTRVEQNKLIDEDAVIPNPEYFRWDVERREWVPISDPTVTEDPDDPLECGEPFRMKASLQLPRSIIIPYLPEREVALHDWKTSFIECLYGRGTISEGTPITPLN